MLPVLLFFASVVTDVRTLISHHDLPAAEARVRSAETQSGLTPDVAAAWSWLGRGALEAKSYDQADLYATETRKRCETLLKSRKLDADPVLPIALGASIEVHAQVLAARNQRSEAVAFLQDQSRLFAGASIIERIHKNINLLSLEGKPAPALDAKDWLGQKPPSLAELRGHPVLLFFWAHWCNDCKGDAPILAEITRQYASKGLIALAPTKFYGYVARGEDAPPAAEKPYIEQVWQRFYSSWRGTPVPISEANFASYGCSTTPTVVLIDKAGIVRYYHPGAVTAADLSARLQTVLGQ